MAQRKEEPDRMIDKEVYVNDKGLKCPFCRSQLIEGGFIEVQNGKAYQEIGCTECKNKWQDVYQLVDIVPIREEEEV